MNKHQAEVRRRELAKIHVAKKQLGMDEDIYRGMLRAVAGAESAADLDVQGRRRVLGHLCSRGFDAKPARKPYPGTPHNRNVPERAPLMRKLSAQLTEAKLPWAYADGIAKRVCKVDKVAFCNPDQLYKVVL